MELIMMAVVVGFTVENLSGQGDEMLRAIDRSDLPVYVAFFTLAGASINFTFLGSNLGVTAIFVLLIGLLTWLGSEAGGWLAGLKTPHRHYVFTGLIAPAGLNLSFATIVRDRLAIDLGNGLTLGESLQTLIVALVAVKQLIGPILFRFALERLGEVHGGEKEETAEKAHEPQAAAGET